MIIISILKSKINSNQELQLFLHIDFQVIYANFILKLTAAHMPAKSITLKICHGSFTNAASIIIVVETPALDLRDAHTLTMKLAERKLKSCLKLTTSTQTAYLHNIESEIKNINQENK